MPNISAPRAPKDFDNVLVRLPARVKQLVSETAQSDKISQNALIASAVLSIMVARNIERMGYPDNILALVRAIDDREADGFPIFGAMTASDWAATREFLEILEAGDVINQVAHRTDPSMPESVMFAMNLTKVGKLIWPDLSAWLRTGYSRKAVGT